MQTGDLGILDDVPFLCWAKDREGKYIWANRLVSEWAGEDVTGKSDRELSWAESANTLRAADRQVLETREPVFKHEYVDLPDRGRTTLNVCKWPGELDGVTCVFGISFVIEQGM